MRGFRSEGMDLNRIQNRFDKLNTAVIFAKHLNYSAKGDTNMKQTGIGKRVIFRCFLGAMAMVLGLSGAALAGDHLSSSSGCTDCHGTNVRDIHDYDYTTKADCIICHEAGGPAWPVNDDVWGMFNDYYGDDFNPLISYAGGGWVLPESIGFDFACKDCHVGQNQGHQSN